MKRIDSNNREHFAVNVPAKVFGPRGDVDHTQAIPSARGYEKYYHT